MSRDHTYGLRDTAYRSEIYIPYGRTAPVSPAPADVAAIEPVTRDQLKAHARVDNWHEDSLLDLYLAAAVAGVEQSTGHKLGQVAIDAYMPAFPHQATMYLPWGHVQRVVEISYRGEDGAYAEWPAQFWELQMLPTQSGVRTTGGTGIYPGRSYAYAPDRQAVRIRYVAGYAAADEIPTPLRQAVLMMAGELYVDRELHRTQPGVIAIPNPAARMLMDAYKVRWPQ